MENSKEKWIDEVLNSTSGIQRASPPPGLFGRVMTRFGRTEQPVIPLPAKHWVAAAILLLALNIGSIIYAVSQNKKTSGMVASNPFVTAIQSETSYDY